MFAKLYGEGNDQVLVKIDSGEDGPEVRFYFTPDNLGVCSVSMNFEDSDEGWETAERRFNLVTEEIAKEVAGEAKHDISDLLK